MKQPFPAYSFLEQAAAEARAASRRYWAKGGEADKKYPCHPMPGWPLDGTEAVDKDAERERRARKKGK